MSKAITTKTQATAPFGSLQAIDPKKLEQTIEQMYFQGKTVKPEQKAIFAHAVNRTGLDPIIGQIRPVLRLNRQTNEWQMAIQTSIDGYRLIADRTGVYAGSDEPVYANEIAGSWDYPSKATVRVWKLVQGQRCPFTAPARWSEYFPKDEKQQFMWKKMPYLMLAKCAEALALRKAFPADLSGIYTDDEMQQAGTAPDEDKQAVDVPPKEPYTAPPKLPPTATEVMEHQNACKMLQPLQVIYDTAYANYLWSAEDQEKINTSYLNKYASLSNWLRQGTTAFVTANNFQVATIFREAKSGKLTVVEGAGEPLAVDPAEQEIAVAERAGKQAA